MIRQTPPTTEAKRAMRLSQIQEQIGRGEYHVDTHAVADAIMLKLLAEHEVITSEYEHSQEECS